MEYALDTNTMIHLLCCQQNMSLFGGSPASPIFKKLAILRGFTISAWQADVEAVQNLLSHQ